MTHEPLETERLVLAPLRPEHAPALFRALADPAVYRYMPVPVPTSEGELAARYRRTSAGPGVPGEHWWNWAVAARDAPEAWFGTVEFSIRDRGRTASLGYVFGPPAWGRGYAREACAAALAFIARTLPLERVEAYADAGNARSQALALRLGFVREGEVPTDDLATGPSEDYRFVLRLEPRAGRTPEA